jgi:hypothetical protein
MQNEVNWEKIGIYLALLVGFLTVIFYIADIKERVAKLEVKIEHLEDRKWITSQ